MKFYVTDRGTETLAEAMRLDFDGEVGIGEVNPQAQLHVGGNAQFEGDINVSSSTGFINLGDGTVPVNNLPNCLFTNSPHHTPSSLAPGKGINVSL